MIFLTDQRNVVEGSPSLFLTCRSEPGRWLEVERTRGADNNMIVQFAGVEDRDSAESLRDCLLSLPKDQMPSLPKDSYYITDLVGLEAVTVSGNSLGNLVDVLTLPAQDVYVIKHRGQEVLVPAVKEIVKRVDVDKGVVVIEPVDGLFEPDED